MNCPNCGAQMKDGHMYCEVCGNEIQIVPEFEPEIEKSILETLSDVAVEISIDHEIIWKEDDAETEAQTEEVLQILTEGKKSGWKLYIAASILFLAAILCIYGFWSNQPDKLYQKAVQHMENGSYEAALASFENAIAKSGDVLYLNGMADCCLQLGDEQQAEELCLEILKTDSENLEAYAKLIRIYKKQQNFERINELLQNCESREIRNQYLDFLANPPVFDKEDGTYREKITVKLIANASGILYYTLDGSEPTCNSLVYTTPLELESGTFEIRAMFVNQYGVESQVSKGWYHVDVSRPQAPAAEPASGEYFAPGYITVEVPEDGKVYYTTDGKVPDQMSSQYSEPIPMPAGNSSFRFIVYDAGGICGEVTTRQYNLRLNAALSMEAAANQLLLELKEAGVLLNIRGDVAGKNGRNIYTYKYVLTIQDNNYYLYREYYEETSGNSNVTGNDYVVNYMTGACFKAVKQPDGSYMLSEIPK